MIGRFTRGGVLAHVDRGDLLRVSTAGGFILAAVILEYAVGAGPSVIVGLAAASLLLTGLGIAWDALRGLARLETNVDELVSLAIIASAVLGEWITAAVVAWIMVLGGLIEQWTSQRARRHIEALSAAGPERALRVEADGQIRAVPVEELRPGDTILARPGDVIAADGVVEEGESLVDQSMLTGESMPVEMGQTDLVSAGTINGDGSLKIRVRRAGRQSTHGKIVELVREAEQHRAPILRAAEAYAKWFTPAVLLLATVVWMLTGEPLRAVTVLIVGCPCAFVLATPTAIVAALGRASQKGILIKGGQYLEACAAIDVLAMDKTGTLTTGQCRVCEVVATDGESRETLLAHAARLESRAEHPLARAVVAEARLAGVETNRPANIRREAGLGVCEIPVDGAEPWRIGNARFMERQEVAIDDPAQARAAALRGEGRSVLFLAEGRRLRGMLAIEDEIRGEAASVLASLKKAGYGQSHILTGDSPTVARRVGHCLEVPEENIRSEMLPEDKYEFIQSLRRQGQEVCYVGDGTNDGPALAAASVGVSIGSRENTVALETAHVVLMRDGLAPLPFLLRLGKATRRTIHQNLILFGLLFNGAMLCLSGFGVLTPVLGALGHNLGSVAVVFNSARLLRFRDA